MKSVERRKGTHAKRRGYVAPELRKHSSLRNITAQGTGHT